MSYIPLQTSSNGKPNPGATPFVSNAFSARLVISAPSLSDNRIITIASTDENVTITLSSTGINLTAIGATNPSTGGFTTITATTSLVINANTSALPAGLSGTLVQIGAPDSTNSRLLFDGFGSAAIINMRRSGGTNASKSATPNGAAMGSVGGIGYGATAYALNNTCYVNFTASENWTDTAHGSTVVIGATANGSTSSTDVVTISAGLVTIASECIMSKTAYITSSDFVKTANNTLADITGLSATLVTGGTYIIRVSLSLSTTSTGGYQFSVSGTVTPSSLSGSAVNMPQTNAFVADETNFTTLNTVLVNGSTTSATTGKALIDFTITVGTGGTITIQFAQSNTTGASSVVAGSFMTVQRVS